MALAKEQIIPSETNEDVEKSDNEKKIDKMIAKEALAQKEDNANVLTLAEHKRKHKVPWDWLPALIKNHGWCLVKCWNYDNLFWGENMALGTKYVGVACRDGETKIACRVKQTKYSVDYADSGKVKETLDEWDTELLMSGTGLGACL